MKYSQYILLISGLLATLISSIINILPIGKFNQAEVSAMFPTLFTPVSFTFSIWGVIYASWIILGIFVALGKINISYKNAWLLAAAQVLSSFWLIPSQFLYIATSLTVMSGVLFLLLLGFFISQRENKYFQYTLELFLGWIIVASIANLHLMLVDYNLYVFPVGFTIVSIILAIIIFAAGVLRYKAITASLVFLWSSYGIIVGQTNNLIELSAGIGFLIILLVILYSQKEFLRTLFSSLKKQKK